MNNKLIVNTFIDYPWCECEFILNGIGKTVKFKLPDAKCKRIELIPELSNEVMIHISSILAVNIIDKNIDVFIENYQI